MDTRANQLLRDFIREKLDGSLDGIRTFDFKTLRGDDKFGCPGRYFDCDDTEIMRAVYAVLWGDVLPGLSMDTLGSERKYRGDTMNTFHTIFGREIPERPGFYAGLEKYHPSDELRERVREFGTRYCSTVGNFTVLPNRYAQGTTLNLYRGTNQWHDFFDRFLIELKNVLCGGGDRDPLLVELATANSFCFGKFGGEAGFRALERILFWEDYGNDGQTPAIVFPMNYHWKDPADAESYLRDAEVYLEKAERIIARRSRKMMCALRSKLAMES